MRLTVGPEPAAVYWRRRAVVFGVLTVVVLLMWSACSGSSDASKNRNAKPGPTSAAPASTSPSVAGSSSSDVLTPNTGNPPTTETAAPPVIPPTTVAAPPNAAAPECADAQLQVTPAPKTLTNPRGAYLEIDLKIKNIGAQACNRDLGPDAQELYLQSGTTKVWSSDACPDRKTGSEVTTIQASIEHSFKVNWDGKAACKGDYPPIGKYLLFGRVGTRISDPVTVQLT